MVLCDGAGVGPKTCKREAEVEITITVENNYDGEEEERVLLLCHPCAAKVNQEQEEAEDDY